MGENTKPNSSVFSAIITSVSLPIIASSIAVTSEYGYFDYYKLPTNLIEISFSNIFNSIITTVLLFLLSFNSIFWTVKYKSNKMKGAFSGIIFSGVLPILSLFGFILAINLLRSKKYEALLFLLSVLIIYSLSLIFITLKENRNKIFPWWMLLFLTTFASIILPIIYSSSKYDAAQQEEYYILKSTPERVILRMYNDIMIVAPFDRTKKEIDSTYAILKTPDITSPIKLERIGLMKIRSEDTPVEKDNKIKEK